MKPCKYLDYTEDKYTDWTIKTAAPDFPNVQYWLRGKTGTEVPPGWTSDPARVQFCVLRGRINGIFQCYHVSGMSCYQPEKKESNEQD